jgi:hypothetical protein
VTRLSEFSSFGRLFTLGSFLKIAELDTYIVQIFYNLVWEAGSMKDLNIWTKKIWRNSIFSQCLWASTSDYAKRVPPYGSPPTCTRPMAPAWPTPAASSTAFPVTAVDGMWRRQFQETVYFRISFEDEDVTSICLAKFVYCYWQFVYDVSTNKCINM